MAVDNIRPDSVLALPLQNQAASARSAALGGAAVALEGDASAAAFNPGLLDSSPVARAGFTHNQWLVDTHQEDVAMAFPAAGLGSLGVSLDYVDYGVFQGRDASGQPTDNYGASEIGLGLGWGRRLQKSFFFGMQLRGLYQSIASSQQFAAAADLGLLWRVPGYGVNLGASYRGLGSKLNDDPQAAGLRLGFAKPLNAGGDFSLQILGGFSVENGANNRLQLGLENVLYRRLSLRAGLSHSVNDPLLGGLAGLSLGLGFHLGGYRIDYCFQPFGALGDAHKVGIEWNLPPLASPSAHNASAPGQRSLAKPVPSATPTPVMRAAASPVPTPSAAPTPAPYAPGNPRLSPLPTVAPEPASGGKAFKLVFGEDDADPEEASLRDAIQAEPKNWLAWRKLADFLRLRRRKSEAIDAYETTLKLHEDAALRLWLAKYRRL